MNEMINEHILSNKKYYGKKLVECANKNDYTCFEKNDAIVFISRALMIEQDLKEDFKRRAEACYHLQERFDYLDLHAIFGKEEFLSRFTDVYSIELNEYDLDESLQIVYDFLDMENPSDLNELSFKLEECYEDQVNMIEILDEEIKKDREYSEKLKDDFNIDEFLNHIAK